MSRIIKFRAWGRYGDWDEAEDKRQFQMIDGDSLCFEEFKPVCDLLEDKEDEEYFMQYTGLKDKNGIEIYEGDIIIFDLGGKHKAEPSVMEWGIAGFKYSSMFEFGHTCEVIGNIYSNPELLNQK